MTQEIYLATSTSAILASDSLVVRQHEDGRRERLSQRKLFALSQACAIVSGGGAVGIPLSRQLVVHLHAQKIQEIEEILHIAPPWLNQQYGAYVRQARSWFECHPKAHQRLYFIIAGCPTAGPPPQAALIGTEKIDEPLKVYPMGDVLTMPRRLALEARLQAMIAGASEDELALHTLEQLAHLAQRDPETVAGPFDCVVISSRGLRPFIRHT